MDRKNQSRSQGKKRARAVALQLVARGGHFTVATAWTLASRDGIAELPSARFVDPEIALAFHLAVGGKRKPPDAVAVVTDMLRTLALAAANRPAARPGARRQPSPAAR